MRSHSVEKRHVCEDCGKAFKRKESLEVHQLTHSKRSGLGLTCDVCQESCRNRADYVTHIKQHIEAGEKMGPDGLQPDVKEKLETESDEDEEEDQYSDGDDDYEPPAYVVKKLPKVAKPPSESDEEQQEREREKEERKDQVVFVRSKDGTIVKKTIKTLMPIQRQETRAGHKTTNSQQTIAKSQVKIEDTSKTGHGIDDTEAEVQKIVASVFKEHKIPLKQMDIPQEQKAEASQVTRGPTIKEEKTEATPKSVNTVKVIKRIVVRKPAGTTETTTKEIKESDATKSATPTTTTTATTTGPKVTKRVIVRRIIRQGDTTREVIMNPDGTIIDPSELAKLPTGNVVKRVVVKKPVEKTQNVLQVLQSNTETRTVSESPKFELKTSQVSASSTTTTEKTSVTQKVEIKKAATTTNVSKDDQDTKEKLEQLEKRVEQQRLKIEELQARKQQEYDPIDEMLPDRHDSEDEQELPLKRVFVKRKQSMYDEEQAYNDTDIKADEKDAGQGEANTEKTKEKETIGNKKVIYIKTEDPSEVEEMSRELSDILDSTDNVVKMQENVLNNLTEISGINENSQTEAAEQDNVDKPNDEQQQPVEEMEQEPIDSTNEKNVKFETLAQEATENQSIEMEIEQPEQQVENQVQEENAEVPVEQPNLSETTDIFETSTDSHLCEKSSSNLDDSVVALSQTNETINLNDTNESQDSLENELSKIAG